jgi:hypothetical protein
MFYFCSIGAVLKQTLFYITTPRYDFYSLPIFRFFLFTAYKKPKRELYLLSLRYYKT